MRINTRTAPKKRTIAWLEERGYLAGDVERREGPITRDLFGIIDVHGVHPERREFIYIQLTGNSGGNVATRVRALRTSPATGKLLRAGARVEVWGWNHGRAEPRVVAMRLASSQNQPTPPGRETQ